jgi:hypothetical protein
MLNLKVQTKSFWSANVLLPYNYVSYLVAVFHVKHMSY